MLANMRRPFFSLEVVHTKVQMTLRKGGSQGGHPPPFKVENLHRTSDSPKLMVFFQCLTSIKLFSHQELTWVCVCVCVLLLRTLFSLCLSECLICMSHVSVKRKVSEVSAGPKYKSTKHTERSFCYNSALNLYFHIRTHPRSGIRLPCWL